MTTAIPAILKLDNAANIYPASMSKHYCSQYRMKVTLSENIDREILQKALETVSERIPTFRCRLKAGAFWWYLKRIEAVPTLLPLTPLRHPDFQEQKGLLYRVSAEGATLYLDVFHALADGNGALCFLLTLAGEYIHRRYELPIRYNRLVLDPKLRPAYFEVEDSFKTVFSGRHGRLEQNVDAYHIRGHALPHAAVRDLRAVIETEPLLAACRRYACTVTELLTSAMLWALQEEHRNDPSKKKKSALKVSVPVNLRPFYDSRTVRNFSSYVNLGVDVREGYLSFEQLVSAVKAQKAHDLQKEQLEPKIAANVELEEMLIVRMLPLALKHPIIDIINLLHGDRFCSQTLSNLGLVQLPEAMVPYVKEMDFILGRQRGNSGAFSCVGYNGKLYLHMTRKIERNAFEQAFLGKLSSLGIGFQLSLSNLA